MTLKIIAEEDLTRAPILMLAGDTIELTVTDIAEEYTPTARWWDRNPEPRTRYVERKVLSKKVDRDVTVTRCVIFRLENEFGMKLGFGGAFGEAQDDDG